MQIDGCATIKKLACDLQADAATGAGDDDIQAFEQRWVKHLNSSSATNRLSHHDQKCNAACSAGSFSSTRRVYEIALLSFLPIMKENENDGEE
jgi:hypothetical protein